VVTFLVSWRWIKNRKSGRRGRNGRKLLLEVVVYVYRGSSRNRTTNNTEYSVVVILVMLLSNIQHLTPNNTTQYMQPSKIPTFRLQLHLTLSRIFTKINLTLTTLRTQHCCFQTCESTRSSQRTANTVAAAAATKSNRHKNPISIIESSLIYFYC